MKAYLKCNGQQPNHWSNNIGISNGHDGAECAYYIKTGQRTNLSFRAKDAKGSFDGKSENLAFLLDPECKGGLDATEKVSET